MSRLNLNWFFLYINDQGYFLDLVSSSIIEMLLNRSKTPFFEQNTIIPPQINILINLINLIVLPPKQSYGANPLSFIHWSCRDYTWLRYNIAYKTRWISTSCRYKSISFLFFIIISASELGSMRI